MSKKKGGSSVSNGRRSNPKYLGLKKYGGNLVIAGNILVRQRGTIFHSGTNVKTGKDHTLYSISNGIVSFSKKGDRTYINVLDK